MMIMMMIMIMMTIIIIYKDISNYSYSSSNIYSGTFDDDDVYKKVFPISGCFGVIQLFDNTFKCRYIAKGCEHSYVGNLKVKIFHFCKAPVTHVLQPVGDCLATKKQLQPMQPLCGQKLRFSIADQSATGRRQLYLKIGVQSAIGRRLVGD